ncbi:MAG: hypothetical protein KAY37_00780 [Phycisphaerae bacterium]|nr:hypothetical protein [Phycisphaerae bacterium]
MQALRIRLLPSNRALIAAALILTLAAGAAAETWLAVSPDGSLSADAKATPQAPAVSVEWYNDSGLAATVDVAGLSLARMKAGGGEFLFVGWPRAPLSGQLGEPALPVVRQFFTTNQDARADLLVSPGPSSVIDLAVNGYHESLVPVQAQISMRPGALEQATFRYEQSAYDANEPLPARRATITKLGIVRGQQLYLLEVRPLSYNPSAGTLTVWPHIGVKLSFDGGRDGGRGPLTALNGVLLNPRQPAGSTARGTGNYLIVVAEVFDNTTPFNQFYDAKAAQGYNVYKYTVPLGTSTETIRDYILNNLWGTPDAPDYLVLIGDSDTIPFWIGGGASSPETDLPYACMDGGDDWYPDMAIGRIAVRTGTHLQNIVAKTLYVQGGNYVDPDYPGRAIFPAGTDYLCGDEDTHNGVIDTYMDPHGHTSDKVYMRTYGKTLLDLIASINGGSGYVIYYGHSNATHWMGFSLERPAVRQFTNVGMYPIVVALSCNSAQFSVEECFAETWTIQNDKAGVVYIGATDFIYSDEDPWIATQNLEWSLFDSIHLDGIMEIGPAWNAALMRLLAYHGPTAPVTRDYFEMYELVGDPSMPIPMPRGFSLGPDPDARDLCSPPDVETQYAIEVGKVGDFTEPVTLAASSLPADATVGFSPNSLAPPFTAVMTIGNLDAGSVGEYTIEITGTSATHERITTVALSISSTMPGPVTLTSPANGELDVTRMPTFTWQEVADAVNYDLQVATDPDFLNLVCSVAVNEPSHAVGTYLESDTQHFWRVRANNGCGTSGFSEVFTFTTLLQLDYFTEQFSSTVFNLEYFSLSFSPDGSDDFYTMCGSNITELPIDPSGGTIITLTDDGSQPITPSSPVSLYGTSYDTFYVNANGNLTFWGGDGTYDESFPAHFGPPRVSVVFDDLNPEVGGTISWQQTAELVAVTWEGVPELDTGNSNTFQAELHFNGDIRLSWLQVDSNDSVVGLSAGGGVPPDFVASVLSAAPPCSNPQTGACCRPEPPFCQDGMTAADCVSAGGIYLGDETVCESDDCNANGVPDVCDLAAGTSQDADSNGIPDECEIDCVGHELDKLLASDGTTWDRLGQAVAVSGGVAVVGAPFDDELGHKAGSVYVYSFNDQYWVEEVKLTASDATPYACFGCSVAVAGNLAVIGAFADGPGAAYVFEYDGGEWTEIEKLIPAGGGPEDRLGQAVAISGDRLVIGAPQGNLWNGVAYVYQFDGGSWVLEATLAAEDAAQYDYFGWSVAIDGEVIVIGARRDDDLADACGAAYVFRYEESAWSQEAKLTASDGSAGDEFGNAVVLTGDTAVIGAWQDADHGIAAGAVYAYHFDGQDWLESGRLSPLDIAAGDNFGNALAMDVDILIVGAPGDDDADLDAGAAYVYRYDGATWEAAAKLLAGAGAAEDSFGHAVAVSSGTAFIGAYQVDEAASNVGAAYVFGGLSDCNATDVLDLCDIVAGTSLDLNGNGIPDECEGTVVCPGDCNCDATISWHDVDYFAAAINDHQMAWEAMFVPGMPTCTFANCDVNGDGTVNWRDIDPLVALMNTTCP